LARTSPNTIPDYLNRKDYSKEDLIKGLLLTNSFILSIANFLTGFVKSKVCVLPKFRGRTGHGFCKNNLHPGLASAAAEKYLWGCILFTKTLLLSNPVSRPGCYD
jgi:hypothetical protein